MEFLGVVAFVAVVGVIVYKFGPERVRNVAKDWCTDAYYYAGDLYRRYWRK